MRAAVLTSVDGAFELRDVPDPVGGEKVLVRVRAAGVNFADVLVRRRPGPARPAPPPALRSPHARGRRGGARGVGFAAGGGAYPVARAGPRRSRRAAPPPP